MTDKERILLSIIRRLKFTYSHKIEWNKELKDGVYFAPWYGDSDVLSCKKIEPGMLVMCNTVRNIHDWLIGYTVEKIFGNWGGWVIKEIGSNRLCNVTNESFTPIIGMPKDELLEQDDYKFFIKVLKAFRKGNEWSYRFGGYDIIEKRKWKIYIREVFGGLGNFKSIPFSFVIKWNKKTSIKYILNKMIEAGYGTKKFERIKK